MENQLPRSFAIALGLVAAMAANRTLAKASESPIYV